MPLIKIERYVLLLIFLSRDSDNVDILVTIQSIIHKISAIENYIINHENYKH